MHKLFAPTWTLGFEDAYLRDGPGVWAPLVTKTLRRYIWTYNGANDNVVDNGTGRTLRLTCDGTSTIRQWVATAVRQERYVATRTEGGRVCLHRKSRTQHPCLLLKDDSSCEVGRCRGRLPDRCTNMEGKSAG